MKQLMHHNYKRLVAIVLLCSPLEQSCQAKLQATKEEHTDEDPKQHTVATPPPAHASDTSQPPTPFPTALTSPGQPTHLTIPNPTSLLLDTPHTLLSGSPAGPTATLVQEAAAKLPTEEKIKQAEMPPARAAEEDAKPPAKEKNTAADALSYEAFLRVPGPAFQAPLLPMTHSIAPSTSAPISSPTITTLEFRSLPSAYQPMIFGKEAWATYFGDVGKEPPLPADITTILDTESPFLLDSESTKQQVKDNHLLVLIPASVNGAPFSLSLLGELIQNPQGDGHETKYRLYDSYVEEQLGAISPESSYWVLMTRDVLVGSRNKTYADQQALVASYTDYGITQYVRGSHSDYHASCTHKRAPNFFDVHTLPRSDRI